MIVPDHIEGYWNKLDIKIRNWISEKIVIWASFIVVYISILYLFLPILLDNAMLMWDHAGLYFSVWFEKEYVFPGFFSWNPFFYTGYAHNQFYPPLYTYLASALSYILPITWSLRILFTLTYVLMPLSFYVLARSLKFSKEKAAIAMLLMYSSLFLFPTTYYGGNLSSSINIGLITHAFGMMLFFFYFASLIKARESGKFILPTILFSAIILSHLVAAIVAGFLLLSFTLLYWKEGKFRTFLFKHAGLSFLLTAFWTIPFILKKSYMSIIYLANNGEIGLLAFISILYAVYVINAKERESMYPLALCLLFVVALAIIGIAFSGINFHFYRLMYFILLLLPLALLSLYRKSIVISIFILVASLFLILNPGNLNLEGPNQMNLTPISIPIDGRVFVVASYDEETAPHVLQHMLPLENKFFSVKGLYVESTRTGEYILNLEKEIDQKSLTWGAWIYSEYPPNNLSLISEILPYQLNHFNINYAIISDDKARKEWIRIHDVTKYSKYGRTVNYSLYKIGDSRLIEIVDRKLREVSPLSWKELNLQWLFSEGIKEELLVDEAGPQYEKSQNTSLEITEVSKLQDNIKFNVNSAIEVPVLVKISYFPNWKAYQDGREIKIYRASPDFMLVYAKGIVEFKYEETSMDKLSKWMSIIGMIILITLIAIVSRKKFA
ncbi:hypothetical protein FJZ18_01345 [Candidatus Pacearchaeota archaeon]|nr:hypothetical protein [Candidatus Pacearchaeota archaeon]